MPMISFASEEADRDLEGEESSSGGIFDRRVEEQRRRDITLFRGLTNNSLVFVSELMTDRMTLSSVYCSGPRVDSR